MSTSQQTSLQNASGQRSGSPALQAAVKLPELVPKASLATLPLAVLSIIVDLVVGRHVPITDANPSLDNRWLPFGRTTQSPYPYTRYDDGVSNLRHVSQVCQNLRAAALPILWAAVHVVTVSELGRLREILKVSPALAHHIKSFTFHWDMGGEVFSHESHNNEVSPSFSSFSEEWMGHLLGSKRVADYALPRLTLLDLAFHDRPDMWNDLRVDLSCDFRWERCGDEGGARAYFQHDGLKYIAPGKYWVVYEDGDNISFYEEGDEEDQDGSGRNAPIRRECKSGPDCNGTDRFIKTPKQLVDCLAKVVKQLDSLETFGWATPVLPMPSQVVTSLEALKTLATLHLDMSSSRGTVHRAPLWQLIQNVSSLSFSFGDPEQPRWDEDWKEQNEADVSPTKPDIPTSESTQEEREAFHLMVANRVLIAAAKAGRLRSLRGEQYGLKPFAIRSLLPLWVQIEDWNISYNTISSSWREAAASLRPLLAHISLWNGAAAKDDRSLTYQQLQAALKGNKVPIIYSRQSTSKQPIKRYFPWLEDAKLAKQVADAWKAVVKRGEADNVKCPCDKCKKRS